MFPVVVNYVQIHGKLYMFSVGKEKSEIKRYYEFNACAIAKKKYLIEYLNIRIAL